MIGKLFFALKFEMILGAIDTELVAESDFLRQMTSVVVEDLDLFTQSAVKLFEYIILSTKCFKKYGSAKNQTQKSLLVRVRQNFSAMLELVERIEKDPVYFAENQILQQISSSQILENLTNQLPSHCTGIRNLMEYLLLELVTKLSKSIDTALSSGKVF